MMTGFALFGTFGFAGTIRSGTTGTVARAFTTAMGQAKTDKQYYEKKQWCDIAFHGSIVALQSP